MVPFLLYDRTRSIANAKTYSTTHGNIRTIHRNNEPPLNDHSGFTQLSKVPQWFRFCSATTRVTVTCARVRTTRLTQLPQVHPVAYRIPESYDNCALPRHMKSATFLFKNEYRSRCFASLMKVYRRLCFLRYCVRVLTMLISKSA
jgi:hypothetical protein